MEQRRAQIAGLRRDLPVDWHATMEPDGKGGGSTRRKQEKSFQVNFKGINNSLRRVPGEVPAQSKGENGEAKQIHDNGKELA